MRSLVKLIFRKLDWLCLLFQELFTMLIIKAQHFIARERPIVKINFIYNIKMMIRTCGGRKKGKFE